MAFRRFPPVLVVALVVLAGCLGTSGSPASTPTPQEEFLLRVDNVANESLTVTVHLVTDLSGVTVQYEGGRTEGFPDVTGPGDLPDGALEGAVRIDPLGNVSEVMAFTGPNGLATVTKPYEGSPRVALYAVSIPGEEPPSDGGDGDERRIPAGELREWNVVRCPEGSAVNSLSLRITADSVSPSFGCDF